MARWGAHSFSYIEKGVSTHEVFEEGTVEQLLHQYRYDDFQSMSFVGVYASFQTNKGETEVAPLIKQSEYNQEARKQKQKTYHPKKEQSHLFIIINTIIRMYMIKKRFNYK